MKLATVHCNRCQTDVEGYVGEEDGMSAGVYVVDKGYWQRFAHPGEKIVCDACMWKDPRYVEIYGVMTK